MTEKITIKQIWLNDTKKDGTPYLDKNQRPYKGTKIVTTDGRSIWGQAYDKSPILGWKVGDTYEVEIREGDSGFLGFRLPKMTADTSGLEARVKNLEAALELLDDRITDIENGRGANLGAAMRAMKQDEPKYSPEDIPFDEE